MNDPSGEPVRVLLVDDHPSLRVGLRVLLEQAPDIKVVGEVNSGEEALAQIEALQPDVVVLDCQLPDIEGAEVAREIRRRNGSTRVVALSAYTDEAYVRGMLEAGASGYLLKSESPQVIIEAVRGTVRSECYFSPAVAARVAAWQQGSYPAGLTEREWEVLQWLARGQSNKEIAQALGVTTRTVDFHVGNVLKKLGVASRVEAALWAREQGIATPP